MNERDRADRWLEVRNTARLARRRALLRLRIAEARQWHETAQVAQMEYETCLAADRERVNAELDAMWGWPKEGPWLRRAEAPA
jgi:hypothetical protein